MREHSNEPFIDVELDWDAMVERVPPPASGDRMQMKEYMERQLREVQEELYRNPEGAFVHFSWVKVRVHPRCCCQMREQAKEEEAG